MLKPTIKTAALLLALAIAGAALAGQSYWIDVRSPQEFASGHVDGAINIPHTEITARIGEVTTDPDARLYLYCRSGGRSGAALQALQAAGFTNAVNVGGLKDARREAAELAAPD